MAKTEQNGQLYQNNYWILRFVVVDEDDPAEPPLDLSGMTVRYALTKIGSSGSPLVASPILDYNSDDDPTIVVVTDAINGEVEVRIPATENDEIKPRDYWQELEVVDALDNPVVAMTGTLTVLPNVVNA